MLPLFQWLGSLKIAVSLLVAIAAVLAWGTFYETRFGTAAVQRFVYQSVWFQGLLAFLAVNLATAALRRRPWQRRHLPFLLAHLGIIWILIGGILGGRFGIEGQLVIPEGESEQFLKLSRNVLVVHPLNPGDLFAFPTRFESRAWVHEPKQTFPIPLKEGSIQLTVDRYLPNARVDEEVNGDGAEENPALHLVLSREEHEEALWLFSRDPDRFGVRWGQAHLMFLEPRSREEVIQLLDRSAAAAPDRGAVRIQFPDLGVYREIPVPADFSQPIRIEGTEYRITFKDYFTDLGITEQGVVNRSDRPNNPAVAFTLTGPEGTDPFLLFSLHPDFPALHGRRPVIHAHATYSHRTSATLPPYSIGLVQDPSQERLVVFTGENEERMVEGFKLGKRYRHPWLDLELQADLFYPKGKVVQRFSNRDDEVRREALHLLAQDGQEMAETWLLADTPTSLKLGEKELILEYRQERRKLPVVVKLIDFRKTNYPGTEMAAGFESDVELTDPERGLVLTRKITMNNPLKYRGFSFFQSGFLEGPVQTPPGGGTSLDRNFKEATVLAVRKDPGTPLVYAGFLTVIAGVLCMFIFRKPEDSP